MNTRKVTFLLLFFIIIVTTLAYLPSLGNGFLSWDDSLCIQDNPGIKNFSFSAILKIFTSFHYDMYKPLVILSYFFEYHFFGLNPLGYHATNLFFHLFNSVLVYVMIFLFCRSRAVSFLTALLFGIHPLHVESVAWVTERKDLLYTLFFLSTVICYLLYRRDRLNRRFYFISLASFVLSLMAKPQGVFLPFVLLAFDYYYEKKVVRRLFSEKLAFFIVAIPITFLDWVKAYHSISSGGTLSFSFDGLLVACHGVFFYIKKIFLPVNLSCFYPYPEKIGGVLPLSYALSPLAVFCLAFSVFLTRKSTKKILFGFLFFLFTLLPVLPLAPLEPGIFAADRYTYLSSIGVFYLLSELSHWLYQRILKKNKILKYVGIFLLLACCIILCFLTYQRTKVWKDDIALWSDCLKKYPSVSTAHLNLGTAYLDKEDYKNAFKHAREALRLEPSSWDTYFLMGNIFLSRNELDQALSFYRKAVVLSPNEGRVYNNIGLAYYKKGRSEWGKAVDFYKQSIKLDTVNYVSLYNLGSVYGSLGRVLESREYFEKALRLDPDSLDLLWSLADYYVKHGLGDEARGIFKRNVALGPKDIEAYMRIGPMLFELGDFEEAELTMKQALILAPSSALVMRELAALYGNMGRLDESILYFEKALKLNPFDEKLKKDLELAVSLKEASKANPPSPK